MKIKTKVVASWNNRQIEKLKGKNAGHVKIKG